MSVENLKTAIQNAPQRPGVYLYKGEVEQVLYVGKALRLRDRLNSYFQKDVPEKTAQLIAHAHTISWIETGSELAALLLEANLIKRYRPKYNVVFRDDKSYLYIFISLGEEFPKVLTTRRPKMFTRNQRNDYELNGEKGEYFGPYPSSAVTRMVLKELRHIIPFCTQRKLGRRPCFYSHIGLCNPCPAKIVQSEGTVYDQLKKEYRVNIFRLKHILEGNFQGVEREIEREMVALAKSENFEAAQILRDRLERFRRVLNNEQQTSAFLDNPNFYFDRQKKAIDELRHILQAHGVEISNLRRIECFDISTFQGNFSVASQIVFIDGVPEKKWYRKYRIRIDGKPNDVAMMRETLSRRLKHPEWEIPDLVMVDGGKPQVGTISKLFAENQVTIPLIGLAKRWEQIVVPAGGKFTQVNLPRRSTALQLLQQMRDEAHRFAITYHRLRRSKALIS